jgi:hypothetical protein
MDDSVDDREVEDSVTEVAPEMDDDAPEIVDAESDVAEPEDVPAP